jgi:hypothetical protein
MSERADFFPSVQIASDGYSLGALDLPRKGPTEPGRLIGTELINCATVAGVSNGEFYAR